MNFILTKGGLGDALVQLNDISNTYYFNSRDDFKEFYWKHLTGRSFYKNMTTEFGSYFTETDCEILPGLVIEKNFKNYISCSNSKTFYSKRQLRQQKNPYLPFKIENGFFKNQNNTRYITIILDAGRRSRHIGKSVLKQIIENFNNYVIVLVGITSFFIPPNQSNIINLQGETHLIDVFSILNKSDFVIGPEGIFTYYALMQEKPTIINYKDCISKKNYFHSIWKNHCIDICSGLVLKKISNKHLDRIEKMC